MAYGSQLSDSVVTDRGRLVPGHCLIVPAEHVASTRQVDEHIWTEIRNFKKCLLQMFMAQVCPHPPPLLSMLTHRQQKVPRGDNWLPMQPKHTLQEKHFSRSAIAPCSAAHEPIHEL